MRARVACSRITACIFCGWLACGHEHEGVPDVLQILRQVRAPARVASALCRIYSRPWIPARRAVARNARIGGAASVCAALRLSRRTAVARVYWRAVCAA